MIADRCPELQTSVANLHAERIAAWSDLDLGQWPVRTARVLIGSQDAEEVAALALIAGRIKTVPRHREICEHITTRILGELTTSPSTAALHLVSSSSK